MKTLKFNIVYPSGSVSLGNIEAVIEEVDIIKSVKDRLFLIKSPLSSGDIVDKNDIKIEFDEEDTSSPSNFIPSVDMEFSKENNRPLRMFGTLEFVESVKPDQFTVKRGAGIIPLKAFVQFICNLNVVSSTASFKKDLLPLAKKNFKSWDKALLNRFASRVFNKSESGITSQDIARLYNNVTGKDIVLLEKNYDINLFIKDFSYDDAAKKYPDELFTAIFPGEFIEYSNLYKILTCINESLYITNIINKTYNLCYTCEKTGIKWALALTSIKEYNPTSTEYEEKHYISMAPKIGTLHKRAQDSLSIFGIDEKEIPFNIEYDKFIAAIPLHRISNEYFETGVKYTSSIPCLPYVSISLPQLELDKIANALNEEPNIMISNPEDESEVIKGLVSAYSKVCPKIDTNMSDRHFIVLTESEAEKMSDVSADLKSKFDGAYTIVSYLSPSVRNSSLKTILAYAYILKHMNAEFMFYKNAVNDDFDNESLFHYIISLMSQIKKKNTLYFIPCYSSDVFGKIRTATIDAKMDQKLDLGVI